jgi:hypothetical protein
LEHEAKAIRWPDAEERRSIEVSKADKLPKCMGFIDGSHVNLDEAPTQDPESYFTRKQRYAIQVQAVCDIEMKIRNIVVGFPGSVHDARVYANSTLGRDPSALLNNGQWIAGDSAYGVTPFLLTPFRNNSTEGLREKREFNKYFASYRVKIECVFGIMKETFGSLKGLRIRIRNNEGHKQACNWIRACCVLYNIVLPAIDESEYDSEQDSEESFELGSLNNNEGEQKRQELLQFVIAKLGMQ